MMAMPSTAAASTKTTGDTSVRTLARHTAKKMIRHFQSTMALFHSFATALTMSTTTQTRMPAKAFFTAATSAKAVRQAAITVMMRSDGATEPRAATMAPTVPLRFCPMKAEVFTMMMPGRHWPMA